MRKIPLAAISMIGMLVPLAASAALGISVIVDGRTVIFSDVSGEAWYAATIRQAAEAGIVSGYRDANGVPLGLFGPGNNVTMSEALKIASEGAAYDEAVYGASVASGMGSHWAAPYVSVAKGESFDVIPTRTQADRAATRAEVAAMIASSFRVDKETPVGNRYDDVSFSTEHAFAIEALSRDEVLTGDTDEHGRPTGTFRPTARINRAEVAAMVMRARGVYGTPGEGRTPQSNEPGAEGNIVTYTDAGFSPAVLRVAVGTAVTFRNQTATPMWVASNPHPVHTDLSAFDALESVGQGGIYVYTFNKIGTFGYHNHLRAQQGGTIIVEEAAAN